MRKQIRLGNPLRQRQLLHEQALCLIEKAALAEAQVLVELRRDVTVLHGDDLADAVRGVNGLVADLQRERRCGRRSYCRCAMGRGLVRRHRRRREYLYLEGGVNEAGAPYDMTSATCASTAKCRPRASIVASSETSRMIASPSGATWTFGAMSG